MKNLDFYTGRLGNRLFQTAYLFAQIKKGLIPDWYLQDPKWFEGYEKEVKDLFSDGIGYLEQVGVHIRRAGNPISPSEPKYSENPFYVNLSETDYYSRAMAMFPDEKFVVFSDDPEWCREHFKNRDDVQIMEKGDEIEDLNLFASCKSQIIANSSWSYWGAFLNPVPNSKVVAPKQWYSDGNETRTVCPPDWIRL